MLLDTSGLLCFFDADEHRHSNAVNLYASAGSRVIHNYVLAEFVALTQARKLPREASLDLTAAIVADTEIRTYWVDPSLHDEAVQMLQTQSDKAYSLCDAVSFVLMRRLQLSEALTTDHHFEQAGYRALLLD